MKKRRGIREEVEGFALEASLVCCVCVESSGWSIIPMIREEDREELFEEQALKLSSQSGQTDLSAPNPVSFPEMMVP
jgi:hypothetical protein